MRLLSGLIPTGETAEERAHPDKTRDVWELAVWDPLPLCLRIFCFFSPGHVLIYLLHLPLAPLDPRPSTTVFSCIVLQTILSVQMLYLQSRYAGQIRDTAIIHKEVLHEYDTKFVHPRLHPLVRDAGTQTFRTQTGQREGYVEASPPTTLIRRGFQTHPNQNYLRHFDPDGNSIRDSTYHGNTVSTTSRSASPQVFTPSYQPASKPLVSRTPVNMDYLRSSQRQSLPAGPLLGRMSTDAASTISGAPGVDHGTNQQPWSGAGSESVGGNLGIHTNPGSPLKKAISLGDLHGNAEASAPQSPRNSREMAALEQRGLTERLIREHSPKKSVGSRGAASGVANPFARPRASGGRMQYERYPSIR